MSAIDSLAIDYLAASETELRDPTARRRLLGPTDQRTLFSHHGILSASIAPPSPQRVRSHIRDHSEAEAARGLAQRCRVGRHHH